MAGDEQERWRAARRDAAEERADALARRKAAETETALRLVADFTREALERGLRSEPLLARAQNGNARYRTGLTGWYVRRDRSLGVTTDGDFHVLIAPASLRARFTGVQLTPDDPPLVAGAGGRDGESVPLEDLLRRRLDAGDAWD